MDSPEAQLDEIEHGLVYPPRFVRYGGWLDEEA